MVTSVNFKYVVLFQRGDRSTNMDEWFDVKVDADKRCRELQYMFDWLNEKNDNRGEVCKVWVEAVPMN